MGNSGKKKNRKKKSKLTRASLSRIGNPKIIMAKRVFSFPFSAPNFLENQTGDRLKIQNWKERKSKKEERREIEEKKWEWKREKQMGIESEKRRRERDSPFDTGERERERDIRRKRALSLTSIFRVLLNVKETARSKNT